MKKKLTMVLRRWLGMFLFDTGALLRFKWNTMERERYRLRFYVYPNHSILYWASDDAEVTCGEADRLARSVGFQWAEQLVKYYEQKDREIGRRA